MKTLRWKLAALSAALVLAACGGGGTDAPNNPAGISALVTFGDSLSDVGSYKVGTIAGLAATTGGAGRWTINGGTEDKIWTERIAALLALPAPCAAETGLSPNLPGLVGGITTSHSGCTNYAEGSARVSSPYAPYSVALQGAPFNQTNLGMLAKPVAQQIAAHLTASSGSFSGKELVMVWAGANDIFMELQVTAPTSPSTAVANVALAADKLAELVQTQLVAKGAKQILVLNLPDISQTPFGVAQGATAQGLISTMVQTFNQHLAAGLSGVSGVRLADAYTENRAQFANPAQYGVSTMSAVACGPNALSNPSTANGTALVCNASNLAASDVSGYFFADYVHPTPLGHKLLSQFVARELAQAGWL